MYQILLRVFFTCVLIIISPIIFLFLILVYFTDFKNPIFISERVGKDFNIFRMYKIRTMKYNSNTNGPSSTSNSDKRIFTLGKFIRRFKIDELTQLINVFLGDMNVVGPRPNLKFAVDAYSKTEKKILEVKPGLTDFASIVFSDEGEILKNKLDPDKSYDQIIRPWKSRLCLIYIKHQSFVLDLQIIVLTIISFISKQSALFLITKILIKLRVDEKVIDVCKRKNEPYAYPPP